MSNFSKLLLSVAALAVTNFAGLPTMAADISLPEVGSTDFSLKLFKHVAAGVGKNVLVSPYSAYVALSMTANGADGTTKAAMAKALGLKGESLDAANRRNQEAMKELNSNDKVQLEIANAIYADSKTKFRATFIDLCAQMYLAEARSEDFADPATLGKINGWCDKKTHGKITKILDRLSPVDVMVLLNSVYFKGSWKNAFKPDETKPHAFTLLAGGTKQVPMMHKTFSTGYLQGDGFQAVSIPYAGERQVMYVFLPEPGADFAAFQGQFTSENWRQWMGGFNACSVNLAMPKYKVEYSKKLNDPLIAMGMGEAFTGQANFSKMFEHKAGYIGLVLQKTYMDVNEEGTEAAAVTAVVMRSRAMVMPPRAIDFTVDRPFVVSLADKETGEILFLGSIVDP